MTETETFNYFERQKLSKESLLSQGNKIRLVDSDFNNSNIELYNFTKCNNKETSLIRCARGVVINSGEVVLQTFPYTLEFTESDKEEISTAFPNINNYRIFNSHEGFLIRVFNLEGNWYISTFKKLNAFRSKWSSKKSFGNLFIEALSYEHENNEKFSSFINCDNIENLKESFLEKLNKEMCYCFLIRNGFENRIVCKASKHPQLYHVGTFSMLDQGDTFMFNNNKTNINLPVPKEHKFSSWDDFFNHLGDIDENTLQGLIVFSESNHFKIYTNKYKELFNVRGNEPSIKYRYLQVRMNKDLTDQLYELYPRHAEYFENYENVLYSVAKSIYEGYVNRYIKKQYVTLPREEYAVMKECHEWHHENREKNRISMRKVIEKLNEQTPNNLNKMIRRSLTDHDKKKLLVRNVKKV